MQYLDTRENENSDRQVAAGPQSRLQEGQITSQSYCSTKNNCRAVTRMETSLHISLIDFETAFESKEKKYVSTIKEKYQGMACRDFTQTRHVRNLQYAEGELAKDVLFHFPFLLTVDWVMGDTTKRAKWQWVDSIRSTLRSELCRWFSSTVAQPRTDAGENSST